MQNLCVSQQMNSMAVYDGLLSVTCGALSSVISQEIQDEFTTFGKTRQCSQTLQHLVAQMVNQAPWCFKTKRNGNPSVMLKTSPTLIRLAMSNEIKTNLDSSSFHTVLKKYAELMQMLKRRFFCVSRRLETDFVDKFYKFEVQNDILKTDVARAVCGELDLCKYMTWVRTVILDMRSVFNVSFETRVHQQATTDERRIASLECPLKLSFEDVDVLIDALWGSMQSAPNEEDRAASMFCLLQLSCGGRARDVLLVNHIEALDDEVIKVTHLTKKKVHDHADEITKPVLAPVIGTTANFLNTLALARSVLFSQEIVRGRLKPEWTQTDVSGCQLLVYEKQWDKSNEIEQIVASWSARMRKVLLKAVVGSQNLPLQSVFSKGKGTHQLRKLYVTCSHVDSKTDMKEAEWARWTLGHNQYNTSLLYTTMTVE